MRLLSERLFRAEENNMLNHVVILIGHVALQQNENTGIDSSNEP